MRKLLLKLMGAVLGIWKGQHTDSQIYSYVSFIPYPYYSTIHPPFSHSGRHPTYLLCDAL